MKAFKNFNNVFNLNGEITIIYEKNKNKAFCQTTIKQITDKNIYLEVIKKTHIPEKQVLSLIYRAPHGLYGFHSSVADKEKKLNKNIICINKPKEGWKIQRRRYERVNLMYEGSCCKAKVKDSSLVPSGKKYACLVVNLGEAGLAYQCSAQMTIGQHILVKVKVDDVIISKECVIIWGTGLADNQQSFGFEYMYGVKFIALGKELKPIISKLRKKYK